MSTLLKDLYSPAFYKSFTNVLAQVLPDLSKQLFINTVFDETFGDKELKDRMRHTAQVLHQFLPKNFAQAAKVIQQLIIQLRNNNIKESSLEYMFLPDYIETYGLNDFDSAVKAMEFVTQFTSCEFAVRPFILKYGDRMLQQMLAWSLHENDKVRRLASEGARPRLPWAMAIPALKKDPTPVLPILENLKNDPSEFVRRSVANNLNDIAKDHPDIVIDIAKKWKGIGKETDAIIKHGCRTLLKQGHAAILKHYGLQSENIAFNEFTIATPKVAVGQSLVFSFFIENNNNTFQVIRLEYAVYYKRQNGQLSKKVFKISERQYQSNEKAIVQRRQSFKPITTRKFYAGQHQLSIIINGEEKEIKTFELEN
ncbi:DNA alkylation repair protein [Flavisolibacter tropicus]|uniref:DNA alkylation repair protein n=1 Tax=Flavisolibacter tropicus TaxID=1492898 RepID=A0A172TXD0_9BACT|nr:DNA alkylation repair protein [Flavisolibacter tropicus]ANE51761.1 DNA alkylation repair protein [Flavisolibacter tropicus]